MDATTRRPALRAILICVLPTVLAIFLAGCGVGSSDDETQDAPTEVSQSETTAEATQDPTDLTSDAGTPRVTSSSSSSSPESDELDGSPTSEAGSPTPDVVVSAPRIVVPTAEPSAATPAPSVGSGTPSAETDQSRSGESVGDGTGGATGDSDLPGEDVDPGTPIPNDSESATTVSGCEVGFYSPYKGQSPEQVTISEVNFRSGPGTDCDVIGEPLPPDTSVQVLSDAIVRDDQDAVVWVAVSVDGTDGWMAAEFLEPAGDS